LSEETRKERIIETMISLFCLSYSVIFIFLEFCIVLFFFVCTWYFVLNPFDFFDLFKAKKLPRRERRRLRDRERLRNARRKMSVQWHCYSMIVIVVNSLLAA
jgi:hypothetical protein